MMLRFQPRLLLALIVACTPPDEGEASATDGSTSTTTSTTGGDGDSTTTTTLTPTSNSTAQTTSSGGDTDPDGTSGTTAATTEGGVEPVCGDGVINGDEECDEGLANSDTAACTSLCKLAYCGDGLIQAGKEACDLEDKNGDGSYGGCTELCQLGPHCGDKILQPDHEECDALDPELADGSRCIACVWEANLMFVSSTTTRGNLGGVDGADSGCQELAAAANLPEPMSFRAWLSDGVSSPQSRFSPPLGALILTNGATVATSWAEIISGGDLKNAINVDENKAPIGPLIRTWSNTTPEGLPLGNSHCNGWKSDSLGANGAYGQASSVDTTWTDAGAEWWCSQDHRFYCIATG